jgi:hypothetical protein
MPTPAKARVALIALRRHKHDLDRAIDSLEKYALQRMLVPRDELREMIHFARRVEAQAIRPAA